jgi:hypothetical protein
MRTALWILFAFVLNGRSEALSPFAFVMIDAKTEELHGTLPFNRQLIATAIERLMKAHAEGVVLKFFYDLPSVEAADRSLELSLCSAPVALQASLNDDEGGTNALDKRFGIQGKRLAEMPAQFVGEKALLPLPRFSRCARAVGFVDATPTYVPLVEVYQGRMVKSLHLVALEMAIKQIAVVDDAGDVRLAGKKLGAFHEIQFPAVNSLDYIPLHVVLDEKSTAWQSKVKHAVVVIGYDGKNIHSINTPLGAIGAYRFFIIALRSLSRTFVEP